MGYPGSELFMLDVSLLDVSLKKAERNGRTASRSYSYDFAVTPGGLELFRPAIDCGEGEARLLSNSRISRGCEFNAGYLDGIRNPQSTAVGSAQVRAYSGHDEKAAPSTQTIVQGQVTRLLAVWTRVSLDASPDIATVRYDPGDLWLQIDLNGRTHWIRGDHDFEAIGLRRDLR
jgi:hypothetical protein